MPENIDAERYKLQHRIWALNYIQTLDLYIMATLCNINFTQFDDMNIFLLIKKNYAMLKNNIGTYSTLRGQY